MQKAGQWTLLSLKINAIKVFEPFTHLLHTSQDHTLTLFIPFGFRRLVCEHLMMKTPD